MPLAIPKIENDPGEFFSPVALSWVQRHSPGMFQAAFGPAASRKYSGMGLRDGLEIISRESNTTGNFQAMMGSSDFNKLLDDVSHIAGIITYSTMAPDILRLSHETADIPDYQPIRRVDGSEFPALKQTQEGSEVEYGSLVDRGEQYSAAIWSRQLLITEQALKNDNLGMLVAPRLRVAESVIDCKAQIITDLIEANPALSDEKSIFHADHNNLQSDGGSVTVENLNTARVAMQRQKANDGERSAAIEPRFILVPPERQTEAEQVVADITPSKTSEVNPFTKSLEVITEPRLADPNAWYLFSTPERQKSLEHGVVNGTQDPDVISERQISTHSVVTRVSLSFGAGWLDHRGAFKNSGVAE